MRIWLDHLYWSRGQNDSAVQLSVSTTQPDQISELLEATRKMTGYLKKSYKNGRSYQNNGEKKTVCINPRAIQISQTNISAKHTAMPTRLMK